MLKHTLLASAVVLGLTVSAQAQVLPPQACADMLMREYTPKAPMPPPQIVQGCQKEKGNVAKAATAMGFTKKTAAAGAPSRPTTNAGAPSGAPPVPACVQTIMRDYAPSAPPPLNPKAVEAECVKTKGNAAQVATALKLKKKG